ncbi:hypothetical protein [uncultured Abyssibacter sp.]|uniref:hypothetical protein n=1 Tax=uncultured Abyssibacter sp. TaxID=2320202 RepID=UPI0032B2480B
MKQIVWALGAAATLAMPAHADWRYLILNEPLDQRVQERRAEPVQPPSSFGNRVDGVLDIVMNGSLRGQAEVIVTADGKTLISGDGARLAGLGFGPGDEVPQSGYFYPLNDLRPAVQARVDGSQLLMQTGVDPALHRTPGISRSETRPAVAPITDMTPSFETRPLQTAPVPAQRQPTQLAGPGATIARTTQPQHVLPWPDALDTPLPAADDTTPRQEEVMIAVDGQPRGVVIARVGSGGQPQLAVEDLQALRLPVPANSLDRGYATPDDLSQTYAAQYDRAAAELRLSTRQPDRWYIVDESDASNGNTCPTGPRTRPGPRARRGDC